MHDDIAGNVSVWKPVGLANSGEVTNWSAALILDKSTIENNRTRDRNSKSGAEGINYANSSMIKRNWFDGRVVGMIQWRLAVACPYRRAHVRSSSGEMFSAHPPCRRINQNVRTCMSTSNSPPVDVSTHAATCPSRRPRTLPPSLAAEARESELTIVDARKCLWPLTLSDWQPFDDFAALAVKWNRMRPVHRQL